MMKKWLYRNSRPLTAAAWLSAQLQSAQRPMPVAQPQDQQHRPQAVSRTAARQGRSSIRAAQKFFFGGASCCMGFKPLGPLFFGASCWMGFVPLGPTFFLKQGGRYTPGCGGHEKGHLSGETGHGCKLIDCSNLKDRNHQLGKWRREA